MAYFWTNDWREAIIFLIFKVNYEVDFYRQKLFNAIYSISSVSILFLLFLDNIYTNFYLLIHSDYFNSCYKLKNNFFALIARHLHLYSINGESLSLILFRADFIIIRAKLSSMALFSSNKFFSKLLSSVKYLASFVDYFLFNW